MFDIKTPPLQVIFCLTVVLHLIVALYPFAFVTHDGPSHLYNAHIINELLFSNNTIYEKYHTFNPNWSQPNLFGYFILCCLQLVVPFLWAEKILVAIYIVAFAFGFRYYLKQVSPSPDWYSLMIFPFIFNTVLFWGFYNFLLGLALSFWLIGLYERHIRKLGWTKILSLALLAVLIFYSHALIFILCAVCIGVRVVMEIGQHHKLEKLFFLFRSILIFFPGITLFLIYLNQQKSSAIIYESGYDIFKRLSQLWLNIDSLFFSGYAEGSYLKMFYVILFILIILKVYDHWKRKISIFSPTFLSLLAVLFIYLIIPDYAAGGGIIGIRINLMVFLLAVAWMSTQPLSKYAKYLIGLFYLLSFLFLGLRWSVIECGARQCKHVMELSEDLIPANSVFSTVHYKNVRGFVGDYQMHSYIDMMSNLDNYIAIKHNSLTLHNYEASSAYMASYFPVIWKEWKSSEYVWDPSIGNGNLEYYKINQFEEKWDTKVEMILSLGSLETPEKTKSIWDVENNYSLIKADSINFLNMYSLRIRR